ncbi:DUF397 domain-containing protein [Kitasatospora xanthocidica]|uniref:DUF397 domain-containing protein n=1 Tax=Kitasatospora xanthocidica TaxID=83382 RepID=A0A373A5I6_9ACTN|nr:DUF397 domain-containing protein [Kitasatospora xanthocidica]RGD62962.1 DUF397 domain-containing protein [Kitasatospora xanthocidica]
MTDYWNGMPAGSIDAVWTKSSASDANGQCVEVTRTRSGEIAVRNSRDAEGPALLFTPGEWGALLFGAKGGEFDFMITA